METSISITSPFCCGEAGARLGCDTTEPGLALRALVGTRTAAGDWKGTQATVEFPGHE